MIDYKAERDASIRKILQYVCEYKDLPQDAYTYDSADIVKECIDSGYLENVEAVKLVDGHFRLIPKRPFVTKAGLEFLFPEMCQNTNASDGDASAELIVSELKRIADAANKRALLAEEAARSAQYEAQKVKRQSRINICIAIIAIVVALLAWLVPREIVFSAISSFLQSMRPDSQLLSKPQ